MSSDTRCSGCGKAIPADGLRGFCGPCLMGLGLEQAEDLPASKAHDGPPEGGQHSSDDACQSVPVSNLQSDLSVAPPLTEKPGDQIGRYRLLEKIGQGGCGSVYMAEQTEPVRRKVALKVIKLGMDTQQVVARFGAERQALALMDHPNIAKVLDAGATDAGRPYFVMELVGGVRITGYCQQHHLSTGQRLELFIQVCQAIQHAHQKGIIHRDIKPSNVLVATHDGRPVPKVIDFGIAKATQGRLTDQTLFTAFEQFIGTPAYMSPEQAELGGLDVDTRSDIYSLGVLLYELLTGKTPFDAQELMAGGLEAMRRTIREKEPPTPSTRLAQEVATTRAESGLPRAETSWLLEAKEAIKRLRGDLDWIVMKCLEKDRARRYETANGLARDIQRHLDSEPIIARPPSTIYKIHKFVRRNRMIASAATALATVLILGVAASTWETIKARHAQREQSRLYQEAQAARQKATENLWGAYLAEARAIRMSGQAGRRFVSLAAIRKATAIRSSPALRNEAIASMVLTDIQQTCEKVFARTRQSASINPTGQRYAVCEPGGGVSIRKLSDDLQVGQLPPVGLAAIQVGKFSPNGKLLLVRYADQRWRVWDWAKPEIVLETAALTAYDFTPDTRRIAMSDGTNVVFYDLATRKSTSRISLHGLTSPAAPGWFRLDPAGERLALFTAEPETDVCILDARSGRKLATLPHAAHVYEAAWHPDGKLLAAVCADKSIHLWDVERGEQVRSWPTESSVSVRFNHRGTLLASSGWDGYTRLWDVSSGRHLISIYWSGQILDFSLDDRWLGTLRWDGTGVALFEVAAGEGLRTIAKGPVLQGSGAGWPAYNPSGTLLACKLQDGTGLWDSQTSRQLGLLPNSRENLAPIGFDAGGQNLIATGPAGLFRVPMISSPPGHPGCFAPAELVSTECSDPTGARTGSLSANGEWCGIVGNERCQIFNTGTFAKQAETGIDPRMRFIALSPNGSLVASAGWHFPGLRVWDGKTGELLKNLLANDGLEDTPTLAFSPDGRRLVAATSAEYCFWDVDSWTRAFQIPQQEGNDFCPFMAFSPDGRIFAGTHSRSWVRLHDAVSGRALADFQAPDSGMITGLSFSPDGNQIAVCESADALRVWDLREIRRQLDILHLDWAPGAD